MYQIGGSTLVPGLIELTTRRVEENYAYMPKKKKRSTLAPSLSLFRKSSRGSASVEESSSDDMTVEEKCMFNCNALYQPLTNLRNPSDVVFKTFQVLSSNSCRRLTLLAGHSHVDARLPTTQG